MSISLSRGRGKVCNIRQPKGRVWQEVEDVGSIQDPECLEHKAAEGSGSADFTQDRIGLEDSKLWAVLGRLSIGLHLCLFLVRKLEVSPITALDSNLEGWGSSFDLVGLSGQGARVKVIDFRNRGECNKLDDDVDSSVN